MSRLHPEKQTFTFYDFITYALSITERGLVIDLKDRFERSKFSSGLSDIKFSYFSRIDLNRGAGENCLCFIKENKFLIAITKDNFEFMRLSKTNRSRNSRETMERLKHIPVCVFLKCCAMLLHSLLIELQKEG